jgi:hypothetical protein
VQLGFPFFWYIALRHWIIAAGRFGTAFWYHPQGSSVQFFIGHSTLDDGTAAYPETSVTFQPVVRRTVAEFQRLHERILLSK